jgi:hypothetical protein
MATIQLAVVGIYFSGPVQVPDQRIQQGYSVLNLLQDAYAQYGPFFYSLANDGSLTSFTMSYSSPFPTRGGSTRPAGTYTIQEDLSGNPAQVWQYYIERPSATDPSFKKLVSKTVFPPGFKIPANSEPLLDGDSVIFRCVSILLQPTATRSSLRAARSGS